MPYSLIFSRNRSNDAPVVFGDVTVPEASIMVDILSLQSKYRRSAGWIYPARSVGSGGFERGVGTRLMFGRTRLNLTDFPPPYNLEFFPEIGRFPYIISVYTGSPDPESLPSTPLPNSAGYVRRSQSTGQILFSPSQGGNFVPVSGWDPCLAAKVRSNGQIWLDLGNPAYRYAWSVNDPLSVANFGNWLEVSAEPGTIDVVTA